MTKESTDILLRTLPVMEVFIPSREKVSTRAKQLISSGSPVVMWAVCGAM